MKSDIQRLFVAAFSGCILCTSGESQPQIAQLAPAQLWQRVEFTVTNVPAATNPFDPDSISLDAKFILPSGRMMVVPGFWYQNYQHGISGGYEYVNPSGAPEWRIRFAPPEPGTYSVSLTVKTNHQNYGGPITANFTVPASAPSTQAGYVQVAAVSNWPTGEFVAEWFSPATGGSLALSRSAATNGNLMLPLPDFTEDMAGIVYSPPRLETVGLSVSNGFQMLFSSETGGRYNIERSFDLSSWSLFLTVTNRSGSMLVAAPFDGTSRSFFRARRLPQF